MQKGDVLASIKVDRTEEKEEKDCRKKKKFPIKRDHRDGKPSKIVIIRG